METTRLRRIGSLGRLKKLDPNVHLMYLAKKNGGGVEGVSMNIVFAFVLVFACASAARAQVTFYQGKTINVVVGLSAGGSADLFTRLLGRYMGKHIPGDPSFVVQNMPGAGSLIAANYLYSVAKPDGLTILSIPPSLYINQLIGRKEVQYDWSKFTWIGSSTRNEYLLVVRADSPYKTAADMRQSGDPAKCSATAPGSGGHVTLKLFEEALGLKLNIVSGYGGGSEQDLAIERSEVQCRAVTTAAFLGREPYLTWQKNGFIRVIAQTPRKRNPKLHNVPTVFELMDEFKAPESSRRLASVILGTDEFGNWPFAGPPGIPRDRVKILREAFDASLQDPGFLEEAKKRGWVIEPIGGEELEKLAKEVMDQPPETIKRLKAIFPQ